ncbi:hypothetical protein ACFFLM_04640 [Deinococcus oregonensis]|uniref:Metallopeptidase domain-containing protein n=1 Tax=Deinococcus oregonensis TaxID=1805970 RepID=A0ABV6AW72_9DEIO
MTYDTSYLAIDYVNYIKQLQRHIKHESHALKVARALDMKVRMGILNRSYLVEGADACIVVQPWWYGNSDMVRHEVAHVMLWWSGLEAEVIEEFGPELGWKVVENLCHHAIAFLRCTQPMVDEAVKRYGVTSRAGLHLRKLSGAPPEMAMRRLVYDDPRELRAGFILIGDRVSEVAQCNWSLPFGWLEYVPKPRIWFPEDANVSMSKLSGGGSVLGVCWG